MSHDDLVAVVRRVVPPEFALRKRRKQLERDRKSWAKAHPTKRPAGLTQLDLGVEIELSYSYITGLWVRALCGGRQVARETRDGVKGFVLVRKVLTIVKSRDRVPVKYSAQDAVASSEAVSTARQAVLRELVAKGTVAIDDLTRAVLTTVTPALLSARRRCRGLAAVTAEDLEMEAHVLAKQAVKGMVRGGYVLRHGAAVFEIIGLVDPSASLRAQKSWQTRRERERLAAEAGLK